MTARHLGILLYLGVLSGCGTDPARRTEPDATLAVPFPAPPAEVALAIRQDDFVGAERCAGCHAAEYATWSRSTHGRAGGPAGPDLVIAPFDGRPIRFADATVTPRGSGARYEFLVERPGEPDERWPVDGVIGGGHMEGGGTQGFVTRRPDGTLRFLPFDWSRHERLWFCNTGSRANLGWVPVTPTLRLADCGDWPPIRVLGDVPRFANCQSCHASQVTVARDSSQRHVTRYTSLAITCETCHGPGRTHLERAAGGFSDGDIGLPPRAVDGKDASLAVCFQCHAVKDRLRPGFLNGAPLETLYSLGLPALGDRPLHPDGRVRTFAYQENHRFSACYLRGGMTCVSCHQPHGQGYQDAFGAPLPERFDDRQCTSCHPSKVENAAAHTRHPAASAGARCVSCHMPYLQQPETGTRVRYARSDHTIPVPRPALDAALGIRGACAQCHANASPDSLDRTLRAWYGEAKPLDPAVAAQLRWGAGMPAEEAAALLLGANGDDDGHVAARIAGAARFFEEHVRGDTRLPAAAGRRLETLARGMDPDLRALALAALHLSDGRTRATRERLVAALRASDAAGDGVRDRWAVALGYAGDRFIGLGDRGSATMAYRRALEVAPAGQRAALTLALANALRDAGDVTGALASYRAALAADSTVPLGWLNYGSALRALGDSAGARAAWERAIRLEPEDPAARFNLGNLAYDRGDLPRAAAWYQDAVDRDPSLAQAHFQLARIHLQSSRERDALRSLRRGLAFDPDNASAQAAARQLEEALR